MEVVVASSSPTMDPFDFNGARTSPYLSAPSSPKRFGEYYLSAPTSPSRLSEFYTDFDYFSSATPSSPFHWEHKPGTPKQNSSATNKADDGFVFFVSGESEKPPSRSAEELFDGGKIKPLKDDDLYESARSPLLSPARAHNQPNRSPMAQGKKAIREAFSPRKKKDSGGDAFASSSGEERRGRDRTPAASISSSSRRVTRSLSPYRVSHCTWEEEQQNQPHHGGNNKEDSNRGSSSSSSLSSKSSSRKWRLRDFLLFRSASEGRGTSKDPFRKYSASSFKKSEEGKGSSSSIRNSEIPPRSRRKEPVSAHELHYARKKAESEDMKKRTFLPYKQGILGRLAGFGF